MRAGERGIADIGDIHIEFNGIRNGLADKLITPCQVANLRAIILAILKNLKLFDATIGVNTDGE